MLKLSQLNRVLAFQQAMGLTGVHYHAHGSEPSDQKAQTAFHARRLGISPDHPDAAKAGTNYQVERTLAAASAQNPRDPILTREFWVVKPQPKPEI